MDTEVRHVFFAAIIVGCLMQVLGQLTRVVNFDSNAMSKEVWICRAGVDVLNAKWIINVSYSHLPWT